MSKGIKLSGLLASGKITDRIPATPPLPLGSHQGGGMLFETPPKIESIKNNIFDGVVKIDLSLIDDSPYQPRMQYDPMEIDNLAHSLTAAGQEDPVTIRQKGGRYELIGGHRRVRAARSLGWTEIIANIIARNDREAELATMVQNEARIDLTDYERGKLYQRALESGFASTQTEIAHLFGTTQGHVSKRLAILKLPNNYITMLEEKPTLFGVRCAESIAQLLKEYPNESSLIEDGVLRITEEGADQTSVKQWVKQMVKQKYNPTQSKDRATITDRAGREIFTATASGRELIIRIKSTEVDAKEVEEIVLTALRQHAEKNNS